MLLALVLYAISALVPDRTAEQVAAEHGAACRQGCIIVGESIYRVTDDDMLWLGRVLQAEVGARYEATEGPATAWALLQGWADWHSRDGRLTLSGYVRRYSAACSDLWGTGGARHSDRVTPRSDRCRSRPWMSIRGSIRTLVVELLRGEVPNRFPGWVHCLALGWERYAAPELIGPFYAADPADTAYYQTAATATWWPWTVRIAPASAPWMVRTDWSGVAP